jgi:ATP/maltotriose-dependent transcriptional regulator MalT
VGAVADLDRGRESYARQAWADAYDSLSAADRSAPLEAEDLERLATAGYMIGREADYLRGLERAHRAHLDAGRDLPAVRCAFWVGVTLALRGEMAQAGGWLGRAKRLLDRQERDCVERGYLLLPETFRHEASGNWGEAAATAGEAVAIAERFGDSDLFALAAHEQGHILVQQGRLEEGLALLDESMVAVTAGELSPIVSGIVYCGVILACRDAHEIRRAREWTAALTEWCDRQPDLVAFTGRCLVHRAEILQLRGAWPEALDEARRARERAEAAQNDAAAAEASYREAELHRVRGDEEAAEAAYREASRLGREPQPGLALLRLAQGKTDAAEAAIRRAMGETTGVGVRAGLLPAYAEIVLAAGDVEAAREACRELDAIAEGHEDNVLGAMAAETRGRVELDSGAVQEALPSARRALHTWQQLEAPHEAARARVLVARACRELGDEDAATLELDAARVVFEELDAAPDLAALDALAPTARARNPQGLTDRELEVLRHLSAGATNKAIAAELVLSVRTVDRHVSNIFTKLGVSSRAAATAYAHEHHVV